MKQNYKNRILETWGREPTGLDDLAQCVIAVLNQQPANRYHPARSQRVKVAGFGWNINRGTVSNTHDCPINGVTNWGGRNDNAPTGYPGWHGRVWVRYAEKNSSGGSDPFPATLTYPGTGGFGGYNGPWERLYQDWYKHHRNKKKLTYAEPQIYSWDYRFFDEDWPDLYQDHLIGALKNDLIRSHSFVWFDPEVEAQDRAFIKRIDEEEKQYD